jgi:hypothetical protein
VVTRVDTEIEPPGLPQNEPDGPVEHTAVHVVVFEQDGTRRAAYGALPGIAEDAPLAGVIVDCVRGCAATRGPDLVAAVERLLADRSRDGSSLLLLDTSDDDVAVALARVVLAIPDHRPVKPGDQAHGRRLLARLREELSR